MSKFINNFTPMALFATDITPGEFYNSRTLNEDHVAFLKTQVTMNYFYSIDLQQENYLFQDISNYLRSFRNHIQPYFYIKALILYMICLN
jgi:hypothetical protein